MTALWIGYASLVSALIGVGAFAVERVLAIWNLPRRAVWIGALVCAVLLPAAALRRESPERHARRAIPVLASSGRSRRVVRVVPQTRLRAIRLEWLLVRSDPFIRYGWAASSLLFAALFVRGLAGVRRRRATWRRDVVRGRHVLVAPNAGPAVVGLLDPRVVIPEWALSLNSAKLSMMLRHEQEHLEARDPAALLLAAVLLIAFPWNAALWWMAHRLRLSIEIDCDARVLRAVKAPREYGLLLLAVGERRTVALPFSASLAERRSLLERRIHAMTSLRPHHPLVASLPFAAIALAATVAAAQSSPPASGTMERAIVEAKLAADARSQMGMTLSLTQLYTLVAAHLPSALQSDADGNRLTIVIDANDNYVSGVMQPPAEVVAKPAGTLSPKEGDERMVIEKAAVAGAMTVERENRLREAVVQARSQFRGDTLVIDGLGAVRGEDIRAIEKRHYERGELGAAALNVLIVKLK